ncbi:glycosyltransferase family 4 protein [Thalassospira indica]|uniref:Glycosyltransferase n=1 Tax=Thalassospira indica TaxID=1891279 RepID=A0ABN5NHM7_9PROT|nr:glycosyltransferase family 4 protein [Thalassospira indica]AXO15715.1 glycosyltransferase [Thalassospira indica]OAZ14122.1 glycosyl transferase [Thalassospira profundimaris]
MITPNHNLSLKSEPSVWIISRVDQARILAKHLAEQDRLVRWDSFWRHDGTGLIRPPSRHVGTALCNIPGRHLLPDLLGKTAQKLRLPARNLYSDIPLSLLAAFRMPNADILHGQGNYSLPAMRRAKASNMITISDVTGQLAETRHVQLVDEYASHGRAHREISTFLAARRTAEARFADAVFAPSDTVADGLQRTGIAPDKIYLVPFTSPHCRALLDRERFARDDTVIRLLYVGNLSLAKGTAHLLAAWKTIRRQFRLRVELTLIGTAQPCARGLLSNLPDGVKWFGPLPHDQVADHMLSSDIFVFPSLTEGSSLATMEAMAAGCAVITTFDAGSPVINHQSGLIIPPRDQDALVTAASALITLAEMRRTIAQKARDQIARDLRDTYGTRVDHAYETILSRHG